MMAEAISIALLALVGLALGYLYLLAMAALRPGAGASEVEPGARFAIAVPAHDEEGVIAPAVAQLQTLDYPRELYDLYVVADHCTDRTAVEARAQGAVCFERVEGERRGKAAALAWLYSRIWETGHDYDAVVVFDADTHVDPAFLRAMAARLSRGARVVQGQHRIRNPRDGLYPALSDAIFRLNNRVFNQGRANLGLSAMNLGDSICLRSDVLRRLGWGAGLTEDYDLRLRLLLDGIRIVYEPRAVGFGEAPATWAIARRQRERWLAGTQSATRRYLIPLLQAAVRRRDPALLDAAAQMTFPSFSTLTVLCGAGLLVQAALNWSAGALFPPGLLLAWGVAFVLLMLFPFTGLALDRAPARVYAALLLGPAFVLWRTALALGTRLGRRPANWVRTPRRSAG